MTPNAAHDALVECLRYFAHRDAMNAALHCGQVRYSPVTFRVAQALCVSVPVVEESGGLADVRDWLNTADCRLLDAVVADMGAYAEDSGR